MRIVLNPLLIFTLTLCCLTPFTCGQQYRWTILAGKPGSVGQVDGTGTGAQFKDLAGITVDAAGNVYVTESNFLRKITPAGVVTRFPESRKPDGTDYRYISGSRLTTDNAGNIYVTTSYGPLRIFTPTGVDTDLPANSPNTAKGQYTTSGGIQADKAGNFYVADAEAHVIRKITPTGEVLLVAGQVGQRGSADGPPEDARFEKPQGLALAADGTIYVADCYNDMIRVIAPNGTVRTLAGNGGSGSDDGTGKTARFAKPSAIALNPNGDLYVVDGANYTIRRVTKTGQVTTFAGQAGKKGYADGPGKDALFHDPQDLAVDASGFLYVTDRGNGLVRKISPAGVVTTLAGQYSNVGTADGAGEAARFKSPHGVAVSPSGDIYVADTENCAIRKITQAGVVTTFAGLAGKPGREDGPAAGARFSNVHGLAFDRAGTTLYVTDTGSKLIRKITSAGQVTTLAGSNVAGNVDGTGTAASFSEPTGIVVGADGLIYVTDKIHGKFDFIIRQITPAGVVTTLPKPDDNLGFDQGLTMDPKGALFTSRYLSVFKVMPKGAITRFAEINDFGRADIKPMKRPLPCSLASDAAGSIYLGGAKNIQKITADGRVTFIEGDNPKFPMASYPPGFSGSSWGVAVSPQGVLYVTFPSNNCILKGVPIK